MNQKPLSDTGGFVAGTLVHTDKGLVPIQEIKVGDRVQSRDENNPDGEVTYKKVLNTFKSPQKEKIAFVDYMTEHGNGYLFCTENHPFWADEYIHVEHEDLRVISIDREPIGWTLAKDLNLQLLRSFDKNTFIFVEIKDRYSINSLKCNSKDAHYAGLNGYDGIDGFVDFSQGKPMMIISEPGSKFAEYDRLGNTLLKSEETIVYDDNHPDASTVFEGTYDCTKDYEDYVFNIEVEDYHTYFVGDIGIWVHNCDPSTINTTLTSEIVQNR